MSTAPETNLVNRIRRVIKTAYPQSWVAKVHGGPFQQAGIPDLLVIANGRTIALEVKCQRPGETAEHARGRATAQQQSQIRQITEAGGVAGVVLDPREALTLIQQALGTTRYHRVRENRRKG